MEDKASKALGLVFEALSHGRRHIQNELTGCVGAHWQPSKGGWVIHNQGWGLWDGMPRDIWKAATEALLLANSSTFDYDADDAKEELLKVIARSYWAGKRETDLASTIILSDGTVYEAQLAPRRMFPKVGDMFGETLVLTGGVSHKVIEVR
jgi:hypothetical protein